LSGKNIFVMPMHDINGCGRQRELKLEDLPKYWRNVQGVF
jgi:hypothetical protein